MATGKQRGLAYLGVLALSLAMGVALSAAAGAWSRQLQRDKEEELLHIGLQLQRAIAAYYRSGPAPAYPKTLEALLKDERVPFTRRHLRRLYADPLTGKPEWGLIKGEDGGIVGVHSLLDERPLKQQGFAVELGDFAGKDSYRQWVFLATSMQ
ncbi:type II secretion system protein [Chromobacterium haemolyticum]|uniref:Type II secretion system protein n=1 Tax=Chromobacterium fluminis TaxID=3044269 RepID=A0ABX0LH49_9NEIS|nr:type II secretion system protein [Chromobacterium haemolyticum]NHR08253.1 type II secretion system protein [Chromobacterium haemolyticum]